MAQAAVRVKMRPSKPVPVPAANTADLLINIDNGGTLTDICVINGKQVYRTKTITTPYDLSKCLFEGLKKASRSLYGEDDVQRLLLATEYIRYSTTQGTNALVERNGPRLGLILRRRSWPEIVSDRRALRRSVQGLGGRALRDS